MSSRYKVVIEFSDKRVEEAIEGVSKLQAYDVVQEAESYNANPRIVNARVFEDEGNGRGYRLHERILFEG